MLQGQGRRFGPVGSAQFGEDIADIDAHRAGLSASRRAISLLVKPSTSKARNFAFSPGQVLTKRFPLRGSLAPVTVHRLSIYGGLAVMCSPDCIG